MTAPMTTGCATTDECSPAASARKTPSPTVEWPERTLEVPEVVVVGAIVVVVVVVVVGTG